MMRQRAAAIKLRAASSGANDRARAARRRTLSAEAMAMLHRVTLCLLLSIAACAKGQATSSPASSASPASGPEARPGDAFIVTRDTPFYDSGCAQGRPNDGKLTKGTRFTVVGVSGNCWNVKLADEDETYIQPDNVAPAG